MTFEQTRLLDELLDYYIRWLERNYPEELQQKPAEAQPVEETIDPSNQIVAELENSVA